MVIPFIRIKSVRINIWIFCNKKVCFNSNKINTFYKQHKFNMESYYRSISSQVHWCDHILAWNGLIDSFLRIDECSFASILFYLYSLVLFSNSFHSANIVHCRSKMWIPLFLTCSLPTGQIYFDLNILYSSAVIHPFKMWYAFVGKVYILLF